MLSSLAWKNIWRNKLRSAVILIAIALGMFAGTYLSAFMSGWMVGTVNDDISAGLSHIQVHDTAFAANSDISAAFGKALVADTLAASGLPLNVSYRLVLTGMLASANNAVGVTAKGVVPADERLVSNIWQKMSDTLDMFLPDNARAPIVISRKLADKLRVKRHSKIVLTFQDVHGEMQSLAFRVSGIYKTSNSMFDEVNVFVRSSDVFDATGLPLGVVHEAAIMLTSDKATSLQACADAAPRIKSSLPGLSVQTWDELNPTLAMSMSLTSMFAFIIITIFLFALSFGIINTMLMAVLERTRELGMLGAIGMSKRRIFGMIMLETVFLTVLGSLVGVALGAAVVLPSISSGIDLTPLMGDSFEDYGYSSIVYPLLNVEMFVEIVALVIVAGIISAIYPARKALKLNPLDAMRTS